MYYTSAFETIFYMFISIVIVFVMVSYLFLNLVEGDINETNASDFDIQLTLDNNELGE